MPLGLRCQSLRSQGLGVVEVLRSLFLPWRPFWRLAWPAQSFSWTSKRRSARASTLMRWNAAAA
eukprot:scaffold114_cov361-Pinguiococcus_pyrenoidosus.AAC.36